MNKLYPNAVARRVWQITPQLLNSWGVKGLILDIDNTLTTHNNPIPEPQVAQWLEGNRRAGIRMIVLSNNHPERVRPFAQALGLEFIADGAKPLKKGYQRCSQALGLPCEQLCMVGDQIFTDVLGGRRAGCRAVLVQPIQPEKMDRQATRTAFGRWATERPSRCRNISAGWVWTPMSTSAAEGCASLWRQRSSWVSWQPVRG